MKTAAIDVTAVAIGIIYFFSMFAIIPALTLVVPSELPTVCKSDQTIAILRGRALCIGK